MDLDLIVVPYESGRRGLGVGAGPQRLVRSGLPEQLERGGHGVRVVSVASPDAENGREVSATFALIVQVARAVAAAREAGRFPLVLSGNCSVAAVGAVAGLPQPTGIVWLDAHGDLNTPETTTSGFFDGMALSILLGRCWTGMAARVPGFHPVEGRNVGLVGIRDLDPAEAEVVARGEVRGIPPSEMKERLPAFLLGLAGTVASTYVHLDLDVLDPSEGRANAYAAAGGLSVEDVSWAVQQVASRLPMGAAALTAYDPAFDPEGRIVAAGVRIVGAVAAVSR